jgi:hypothetical protein
MRMPKSIYLQPVLIGKPGHKGGNFTFRRLLANIKPLLGDSEAYCTTLFDFYRLPNDFPGKTQAQSMTSSKDKAHCIVIFNQSQHPLPKVKVLSYSDFW